MLRPAVLRRVLFALRDGDDRTFAGVCLDASCTPSELHQMAEAGFLRFPSGGKGQRARITPKGTDKYNACKRAGV